MTTNIPKTPLITPIQLPKIKELKPWVDGFNWAWLLQRAPIIILSVESAANVFKYLEMTDTDPIISIIGAGGFDTVFIGMVALGDQIREIETNEDGKADHSDNILFWSINGGALLAAFLFGLLAHSQGSYSAVTFESFTRAMAFPFLSLLYNLYFDRKVKIIKIQAEKQARAAAKAKEEREYPLTCPYCSRRWKEGEENKRNGHIRHCKVAHSAK